MYGAQRLESDFKDLYHRSVINCTPLISLFFKFLMFKIIVPMLRGVVRIRRDNVDFLAQYLAQRGLQ